MDKKRKRIAAAGALCGVVNITKHLCPLPDFLEGLLIGIAIALLILPLLPEKALARLKEWKRHGE